MSIVNIAFGMIEKEIFLLLCPNAHTHQNCKEIHRTVLKSFGKKVCFLFPNQAWLR